MPEVVEHLLDLTSGERDEPRPTGREQMMLRLQAIRQKLEQPPLPRSVWLSAVMPFITSNVITGRGRRSSLFRYRHVGWRSEREIAEIVIELPL